MAKTYTKSHLAAIIAITIVSVLAVRGMSIVGANKILAVGAQYGIQQAQVGYGQILCKQPLAGTIAATSTPLMITCDDGSKRGVVPVTLGQ